MDVKVEVKKADGSMEHVMIDSQSDTIMISMMFNDEENVDIVELLHGILKAKKPDVNRMVLSPLMYCMCELPKNILTEALICS